MSDLMVKELPIPPHFNPERVGEVWRVPYQQRADQARRWSQQHNIRPSAQDQYKIALMAVDVQNTFCIPDFELYVGGRSGTGAVDDTRRLVEFIYRNLGTITEVSATLDTHQAMQIFHPIYLINDKGEHPDPLTLISVEDVEKGRWKFNPVIGQSIGASPDYGQKLLLHYTKQLREKGKYELTIWPYHSMVGGIGHALVSAMEEAVFFHTVARYHQADLIIKGTYPLTESYSAIGPEVEKGYRGEKLGDRSKQFLDKVVLFDVMIIAGQAKSHCVAWTVDDLISDIQKEDPTLIKKIYLLEDCTSPVVVPGVVDYTEEADGSFRKFAAAGVNIVRSTDPIATWPGIQLP